MAPTPDTTPASRWHVSPLVDLLGYAFSWVWVVVPLAFLGDLKADYMPLFMLVVIVTEVHRHFGFPYVYMDKQVLGRFPLRFALFPAVMAALWLMSPSFKRSGAHLDVVDVGAIFAWIVVFVQVLRRDREGEPVRLPPIGVSLAPGVALGCAGAAMGMDVGTSFLAGGGVASLGLALRAEGRARWVAPGLVVATAIVGAFAPRVAVSPRALLNFAAVAAATWNLWHVFMQKYGILRLYNAKSGNAVKVPGWVDRLLVFGWLPLYVVWLGTTYRSVVMQSFPRGRATLGPVMDGLLVARPYLLAPAIAFVLASVVTFLVHERRANGLANPPRLWMAIGTTLLASTFLFVHPVKAYLAYAFSHAVEYMVFVWAFQRRRYAAPLAHQPLLGRVLRHPALAYGVFTLGLGVLFLCGKYWGRNIFTDQPRPTVAGIQTKEWLQHWTVFQSMMHFYFDGFLWKMRLPANRANI